MKVKNFSNEIALSIGLKALEIASSRQQVVGVLIERLNHTIMFYMMDGLSKDKENWLKRKANSVKHFEMSTYELNEKLKGNNDLLVSKYGLTLSKYTSVPGGIPVELEGFGLIGVIAITGLTPEEDHNLVIEAIEEIRKEAKYGI